MQGQWNKSKIGYTNFNLRPLNWECKNCLFPLKAKTESILSGIQAILPIIDQPFLQMLWVF